MKKIEIQPIGRFFPQANDGAILNDTAPEKIPSHWLPVISKIKNSYLKNLGKKVHSIYLRGSLPRGLAVDGFSDVDTFAVVESEEARWKVAPWQVDFEQQLQSEFPFVKSVEMMLTPFHFDIFEKNPRIAALLKTQSLCIFGNDLAPQIPSIFPGKKLQTCLHWLEEDVADFFKKEKKTKADGQAMMKCLVRSGFELVMEREGKFTPDLYFCWQVFSKYFPEKKMQMREALHLYLNPSEDTVFLAKFVAELGNWVVHQIKNQNCSF